MDAQEAYVDGRRPEHTQLPAPTKQPTWQGRHSAQPWHPRADDEREVLSNTSEQWFPQDAFLAPGDSRAINAPHPHAPTTPDTEQPTGHGAGGADGPASLSSSCHLPRSRRACGQRSATSSDTRQAGSPTATPSHSALTRIRRQPASRTARPTPTTAPQPTQLEPAAVQVAGAEAAPPKPAPPAPAPKPSQTPSPTPAQQAGLPLPQLPLPLPLPTVLPLPLPLLTSALADPASLPADDPATQSLPLSLFGPDAALPQTADGAGILPLGGLLGG